MQTETEATAHFDALWEAREAERAALRQQRRIADEAPAMLAALRKAEAFLAGFEGDTELLDNPIDGDLAEIRAILARIDGKA